MSEVKDKPVIHRALTPAERKKAYKERQYALGRRQRVFWLDENEFLKVKSFIDSLRED